MATSGNQVPPGGQSSNQLFCCKSIDKLISDSESPERSLKKTLGPVSLTALGIGAVIGSGIFTVIGTAIAGQKFDTSSILNAPLLDYLIRHTATHGRSRRRARSRLVAGSGRRGLRLHRPLLCRTGVDDSHCGQRLHLHLRHHGRAHRLDHRLGSDSRIRRQ